MIKRMKQAFDDYYKKLDALYKKEYGTHPTVVFDNKMNRDIVISEENSDGDVEWKLYPVNDFSEKILNDKLGFKISKELYEYYAIYFYAYLVGKIDDMVLYFTPNGCCDSLYEFIKQQYMDACYYFPEKKYFLLGTANKRNNDDMLIFFDNDNNRIFLHDTDLKSDYELDDLMSLIGNMEVCE